MSGARRQWTGVVAVVLLLALLVGAGWTVRGRFLPVDEGTRAPAFAARDLRGAPVSLASLRGQVVLLNLWATWCGPCRQEMPSLQRLHQRLGERGLRIVAVSLDAAPGGVNAFGPGGDVAAFVREEGLTFTVWHDPSGQVGRLYRSRGLPESYLLGRDGRIVRKVVGATEWDTPEKVAFVRGLLEEG
ncbi:MAG TPA: TlpA disulfide reductase family protein [Longimicrobiaceae bacterium]|nr:TlpA disulfide reductase family protein [Longimicrobiaceae bacterium]